MSVRARPIRVGVLLVLLTGMPNVAAAPKVIIEGVRGKVEDNVRAHLSVDDEPCDAPTWSIQGQFKKSEEQIRKALQAFGYYEPTIQNHLTRKKKCWQATFRINRGASVKVRKVQIKFDGAARNDPAFLQVVDKHSIALDTPLRHERYDTLKRSIESLAAERGYFDGQFLRHEILVDPRRGYADIVLHYDSGARYRFGTTRVHQE